jgi:hypothetical protein
MSISLIRTRLASDLGAVAGIKRVYADVPNNTPEAPDMPCYILNMRDPMVTTRSRTNSTVDFTWHFDLTLLYKPEGLGNPDENMTGLENYIALTVDALYGSFSGGGTWDLINKDEGSLQFTGGVLTLEGQVEGARAWGFSGTLDVTEFVDVTMSSGT